MADKKLYGVLGLAQPVSEEDVKRAYRKMALKFHPDKNPEGEEQFKEITHAYEILSDPEKKKRYDLLGDSMFEQAPTQQQDILRNLFNGFFGGGNPAAGPKKQPAIQLPIEISLEDLYCGAMIKKMISVNRICSGCSGVGGKQEIKCSECDGKGIKIVVRQMGPIVQQMQTACQQCRGTGQWFEAHDICGVCKGSKIVKKDTPMEFSTSAGQLRDLLLVNGAILNFQNQGHEYPNHQNGDLLLQITHKPHEKYTLAGKGDLQITATVPLVEALTGAKIAIERLDKTQFEFIATSILEPGQILTIENEGMQLAGGQRGKLLVNIKIEFPKSILLENKTALTSILK